MKRFFGLLLAIVLGSTPLAARADGGPYGYEWPGWKMSSSEGFNLDTGPSNVRQNRVSFPMTNLLDGNPSTPWVWDDAAWKKRDAKESASSSHTPKEVRSFSLVPKNAVVADELWLMNGYNKSRELFLRNDRIVEIRINYDNKPVKRVTLSDTMGWHKITIPRRVFKEISIDLVGIRKGLSEDNDICLSELALYSRGKKLDFQMPRAVIYYLSYCCGGTGYLLNSTGQVLAQGSTGEGSTVEWSPDERRIAGITDNGRGRSEIWIADVSRARVVRREFFRKNKPSGISWINNRTLQARKFIDSASGSKWQPILDIHSPV